MFQNFKRNKNIYGVVRYQWFQKPQEQCDG